MAPRLTITPGDVGSHRTSARPVHHAFQRAVRPCVQTSGSGSDLSWLVSAVSGAADYRQANPPLVRWISCSLDHVLALFSGPAFLRLSLRARPGQPVDRPAAEGAT